MRDLVPFVQFKKHEKHPWRSVTFSAKGNTPPWAFFTFLKLRKWYQIAQSITISVSCKFSVKKSDIPATGGHCRFTRRS